MRPSTVPAGTCAPGLSRLITIWSRARPSARAGRERPVDAARARGTPAASPPAIAALARVGWANRRSLTGGFGAAAPASRARRAGRSCARAACAAPGRRAHGVRGRRRGLRVGCGERELGGGPARGRASAAWARRRAWTPWRGAHTCTCCRTRPASGCSGPGGRSAHPGDAHVAHRDRPASRRRRRPRCRGGRRSSRPRPQGYGAWLRSPRLSTSRRRSPSRRPGSGPRSGRERADEVGWQPADAPARAGAPSRRTSPRGCRRRPRRGCPCRRRPPAGSAPPRRSRPRGCTGPPRRRRWRRRRRSSRSSGMNCIQPTRARGARRRGCGRSRSRSR